MKTYPTKPIGCLFVALLSGVLTLHAQWSGEGAGGTGTNFNDSANWTSADINGDFSSNTTAATIELTQSSTSVDSLNFVWAVNGNTLTINGNGSGANEILTVNGNILMPYTTTPSVITLGSDVTLDLGNFSTNREVIYSSGSGQFNYSELVVNGLVTGASVDGATFRLSYNNGTPALSLNNSGNTFDAPITIVGRLNYASIGNVNGGASALGAPTSVANGTITLVNSSVLNYTGSIDQTTDRALNVSKKVSITHEGESGILTFTSDVALGADTTLTIRDYDSGGDAGFVFDGSFTGGSSAASINHLGFGTLVLNGEASTYTGATTVSYGTIEAAKLANGGEVSSIGASTNDSTNLVIGVWGYGGTFRYVGEGDSTDRLFSTSSTAGGTIQSSGIGALHFTNTDAVTYGGSAAAITWKLGGTNTDDNTMAVAIVDNGANAVGLTKQNSGSWRLTGTNTYTGVTQITGGTLSVDGTIASSSGVTVSSGATLAGSGYVSGISGAGTVAPGNSPGILTATTLDFSGGVDLAFEMTQETPNWSASSASGNDVLRLASATPMANAADLDNTISVYFSGTGTFVGGIFTDANSDFLALVSGADYVYYIQDVSGSFEYNSISYALLDSSSVTVSTDQIASANFADGTVANGWVQQFTVVPEPGSYAFFCGSVILMGAYVLRRKRQ